MMVLNIALIYYPAIGILQPSMERSVNYDECLLVSLFDHIRNPVILEKRNAKYMKVSKCQSKSFITPINEAKFPETPETILCAAFNQTIAKVRDMYQLFLVSLNFKSNLLLKNKKIYLISFLSLKASLSKYSI
ncbi:GSCOCG00008462001-RA-CDS [Cotesia congregata]|nr:GSCOCG00008462001-RA-CDS [Cotesia congregata]